MWALQLREQVQEPAQGLDGARGGAAADYDTIIYSHDNRLLYGQDYHLRVSGWELCSAAS